MSELFRNEVVQRRLSEIGVPLGVTSSWTSVFVATLTAAIIAGFVVIAVGSYSRKSRVSGFLVPDKGLIKVLPLHAGRITELRVIEGQHVVKDDIVVVIDVSAVTMAGRTADLVVEKLRERRKLITEELDRLSIIQTSARDKLDASIASLKDQIEAAKAGLEARKNFRRLSKNAFNRNKVLEVKEVYSAAQSEKAEQDMVSADVQIAELDRALVTSRGDLAQAEAQKRGLADHQANDRSQLERILAEIDQQIFQIEDQRLHVVKASESGTATGLTATIGAAADPKIPLMTIVPDNAQLVADLYVPSNAAGFVKNGAQVLIRYEAYPYQKFGIQEAHVTSISRTSVNVSELPFPVRTDEPLYLITAELSKYTVTAFGREEPLQAGAKFQADLVLEDRKLWEWAIEPLIAAKQSL